MTDPLASFRREQPTASAPAPAQGLKIYEAFKTRDRAPERLEIRRVLGEWHAPSYRYLMDVSYNGGFATELVLIYSFMVVKIAGRSMQPIIQAIQDGTCIFIQDFHPQEFTPPQPGAAIITQIDLVVKERE